MQSEYKTSICLGEVQKCIKIVMYVILRWKVLHFCKSITYDICRHKKDDGGALYRERYYCQQK